MDKPRTKLKLLIIGAGGFGREVKWLVERINAGSKKCVMNEKLQLSGFIDDGIEGSRGSSYS